MDHPDLEGFSLSRFLGKAQRSFEKYGPAAAQAFATIQQGGASAGSLIRAGAGFVSSFTGGVSTPGIVPTGTTVGVPVRSNGFPLLLPMAALAAVLLLSRRR